jgi:O-antigen/teichoic acid export membrane protein
VQALSSARRSGGRYGDPVDEVEQGGTERGRHETRAERWDRNWSDIEQELRIIQTGTQILAGFLLTLPFQQRFGMLDHAERSVYLVLVVLAAAVTILALGAVATHRLLFRQRQKHDLIRVGNVIVIVCLVTSGVLFAGTVLFVFDVVLGRGAGVVTGVIVFVATGIIWTAIPLLVRRTVRDDQESARSGQRR